MAANTTQEATEPDGQYPSDHPMDPTLRQVLAFPSPEEFASRESLFTSLASSLLGEQAERCKIRKGPDAYVSTDEESTLALVQIGLYGMGFWTTSDTMECLCIGTMSDDDFVTRARQNPGVVKLSPRVFRNTEETEDEVRLIISKQGVSINIQYCQTSAVEDWNTLHSLPAPKLRAPPGIVKALNGYRDIQYISDSIHDLGPFRIAYRFIVRWAHINGLFSRSLRYLDHTQILFMLNKVVKLNSAEQQPPWYDIVRAFFRHYSNFNWESETVVDSIVYELNSGELPFNRGYLTPAAVLTINTPLSNVASLVSDRSLETLVSGYKRAEQLTADSEYGRGWLDLLTIPTDGLSFPAKSFIDAFGGFICFEIQYWGPSVENQATFYKKMEEEFISLCVKTRRRTLRTRPWPKPFMGKGKGDEDEKTMYLIGYEPGTLGNAPADRRGPLLERVCSDFIKYFNERGSVDPILCRVDISIIERDALGDIACDTRDWSSRQKLYAESTVPQIAPKKGASSGKAVSSKLRPASDVLNRLVWDPNIDRTSYIIGYEDRFLGSKELPLALWKTEPTEEEFIPQHRILYFKRKDDREIVWDRSSRVDKIFGSGRG